MTGFRKALAAAYLFLLCAVFPAYLPSYEYRNAGTGYSLDLPEGWALLQEGEGGTSAFTDGDSSMFLQVFCFAGGSYESAASAYDELGQKLGIRGEGTQFAYSGRPAVFGSVSFSVGTEQVTGYFLTLDAGRLFAVLAYTPAGGKEDFLLSAIDSFSPDAGGMFQPGPVSQFAYPFPGKEAEERTVIIGGRQYPVLIDPSAYAAGQALVEREARVLVSGTGERDAAWQRYYRMIYRDAYYRLTDISAAFARYVEDENLSNDAIPAALLAWIQGFAYERTGTLSDLLPPYQAAATQRGDCDSRALVYVIMLRHFSFDSVLFVSSRYSHSIAGVAMPGQGARMEVGKTSYLVAETTKRVALGLIARDMADPSGWLAVTFGTPEGM